MWQTFVDQLVSFYYLLSRVKSRQSMLTDCSPGQNSRRVQRLVKNLTARRSTAGPYPTAGLCPIFRQLESLGGPAAPSVVVRRRRKSRRMLWHVPDLSNREEVCRATLNITRELCRLLSCMHKFYRRCSFWAHSPADHFSAGTLHDLSCSPDHVFINRLFIYYFIYICQCLFVWIAIVTALCDKRSVCESGWE